MIKMSFVKCFDAVTMVTDEATKQFGSLLREDQSKKDTLRVHCNIIDSLVEKFEGVSFEVEVDDTTTDITISLECGEFEIESGSDDFYKMLSSAKQISFNAIDEDTIQINFKFGGIWGKAW